MASTLIANLGDSPAVIAALVHTLHAQGKTLNQIEIFYPAVAEDRWIGAGFALLEDYLASIQSAPVVGVELPFADATTTETSLCYLRHLCTRLAYHERCGNHVLLGISGGRKHISALMALPASFYHCVEAILHLHDREGDLADRQFTSHQLTTFSTEQRRHAFTPPASRFNLVHIPHIRLADGPALRRWLASAEQGQPPRPITIVPSARSFYHHIFGEATPFAPIPGEEPVRASSLQLIAPLGDSPLVVTQACALLATHGQIIAGLHIVYPAHDRSIADGANLLKHVCNRCNIPFSAYPAAIADLDDDAAIEPFQASLQQAVVSAQSTRDNQPPHDHAILLSGGRKGMAALALDIAQRNGITRAYHTTILRLSDEEEIISAYKSAYRGPYGPLAQLMFNAAAEPNKFALIEVPVIGVTV
ncbi:MAG: hypothetical protein EI684_16315 [Candidatus Viridilinea halotolerans]|uniref:CRISPR system ring nuclease SSO2081-like domain-containing protein n=1 Tax=Candidatus Viridilinea halotolerans TaxID=2491704 RepID=A0A426TUX2_9CHLR|nr:MAG: hypothetical protein EI684_16315 [Candidatus Viridilinea halotolerans]